MAEKVIEIPEIKLRRLTVVIVVQTPLITHRFGEKARQEIESKQQKKATLAKEARDPEAEFRDSLYVIDIKQEQYGFPAAGIKKALVYGGGRFAAEKMTVLRGILNVMGDLLEIKGPPPVMRSDPAVIGNGVKTITYRPMFFPWEVSVPIVFNSTMITEAQVLNLFQIAGFAIGIGDWRPEKNGTFGQFSIKTEGGVMVE